MADIVLTTLNARFSHAAFGLRYLLANLGHLQARARILEFDINQRPIDVAEVILREDPKIIGLGVYIWNARPAAELAALLKRLRPQVCLILGGPEVSYETDEQDIVRFADCVITGEADLEFARVCAAILDGGTCPARSWPRHSRSLIRCVFRIRITRRRTSRIGYFTSKLREAARFVASSAFPPLIFRCAKRRWPRFSISLRPYSDAGQRSSSLWIAPST